MQTAKKDNTSVFLKTRPVKVPFEERLMLNLFGAYENFKKIYNKTGKSFLATGIGRYGVSPDPEEEFLVAAVAFVSLYKEAYLKAKKEGVWEARLKKLKKRMDAIDASRVEFPNMESEGVKRLFEFAKGFVEKI